LLVCALCWVLLLPATLNSITTSTGQHRVRVAVDLVLAGGDVACWPVEMSLLFAALAMWRGLSAVEFPIDDRSFFFCSLVAEIDEGVLEGLVKGW
jgi:hypothetical protein